MSDQAVNQNCPSNDELRSFDLGVIAAEELDRLSQHIADCDTCHRWISGALEDTLVMASVLTSGKTLLDEPEYIRARQTLLESPEAVSEHDLDDAETQFSSDDQRQVAGIPSQLGSYRIGAELGRGGMGIVYRARHANLKRDAAVKVLHPRRISDPAMVQRFYGEMAAIGRLRDPHIVQAHDAGESSGIHFLAMEYVDGVDAGQCARQQSLSVADACEITRQAALGLETARQHNMVHRDIKPSNLMVTRAGLVKILDLGLASFRSEGADSHVEDKAVGTADYMAPEQWTGSPHIDIRADIYSLGCSLVRLLTGGPPFVDAPHDGVSKLQAHLFQNPPRLREIRRDVPRDLETLVGKMLAKNPKDRIGKPQEVADALEGYCTGSDLVGLVEKVAPEATSASMLGSPRPDRVTNGSSTTHAAATRLRRWMLCITVIAAAGIFGLLGTLLIRITDRGTLQLSVDQDNVTVEVGSEIFPADQSKPLSIELPSGTHEIKVSKDGFDPRTQKIRIARGTDKPVDIKLLPKNDSDSQLNLLVGHDGAVGCVDVSADGKSILTGAADGTIRLWDTATREEIYRYIGHGDIVTDVAFVAGRNQIVSASKDRTVLLWDQETGERIRQFPGHTEEITSIAVSLDGSRLLTGSADTLVRVWDMENGELLATLAGHRDAVRDVAFVEGAPYVVSCGNDRVAIVWDYETGEMRYIFQGHSHAVNGVSVSSDGKYVVSCSTDKTLRLWDLHSQQQLKVMRWHGKPVRGVRFLRDTNHVVSCGDDLTVRLWNPFSGVSISAFSGHKKIVNDVAVHGSAGFVVSASADQTARIWKLPALDTNPGVTDLVPRPVEPVPGEATLAVRPTRTWQASASGQRAIAVSPDGKFIATGGNDSIVRIWKARSGELEYKLDGLSGGVLCLEYSPNNKWLVASTKRGKIYVWTVADLLESGPSLVESVSSNENEGPPRPSEQTDSVALAGSETHRSDDSPIVRELTNRFEPRVLNRHQGWVTSLAFSRKSDVLLSSGFDSTVRMWDTTTWMVTKKHTDDGRWIHAADLGQRKNGLVPVSGSDAGQLRFWNIRRPIIFLRPARPVRARAIQCAALSPNCRVAAASGWARVIRVWSIQPRKLQQRLRGHDGPVYDVDWLSENRLLSASADCTLRLWDVTAQTELMRYIGHQNAVRGVSFSADRSVIASTGEDGMVCLWPNVNTAEE